MSRPYQLNVTPSEATLKKLDDAVEKYGERHRVAKNRNVIAADILDKFIDLWTHWLEESDTRLLEQLESMKNPKPAGSKPAGSKPSRSKSS